MLTDYATNCDSGPVQLEKISIYFAMVPVHRQTTVAIAVVEGWNCQPDTRGILLHALMSRAFSDWGIHNSPTSLLNQNTSLWKYVFMAYMYCAAEHGNCNAMRQQYLCPHPARHRWRLKQVLQTSKSKIQIVTKVTFSLSKCWPRLTWAELMTVVSRELRGR